MEDLFHDNISNVLSISEWEALGTCMCNGHASMCSPVEGESLFENKVKVLNVVLHYYSCKIMRQTVCVLLLN